MGFKKKYGFQQKTLADYDKYLKSNFESLHLVKTKSNLLVFENNEVSIIAGIKENVPDALVVGASIRKLIKSKLDCFSIHVFEWGQWFSWSPEK